MALRNAAPETKTAPAFETMDEGTTTTVAAEPTPAANEEATATTAVAVAPVKALAMSKGEASAFAQEVESLKGAADFAHGNYPVFKGNNGEITCNEKKVSLGRWAKVSMIAWDDHYEVSPNSDSDKAKDFVAYSKDGITIDHVIGQKMAGWAGKAVSDYVEFLQNEEDYEKAGSRRFIDVAAVVHEADSSEDYNGEVIQVTLSKSSIPSFSQYQEKLVQKARAIARGIPGVKVPTDPFTFYFLRQLASANGKNWTKLEVLDKLPAKI